MDSREPEDVESRTVELRLTNAEALVLFEWLATTNDAGTLVADDAERRVLWDLECLLETKLVEPLSPHYDELLQAAKRSISHTSDSGSGEAQQSNGHD